MTRGKKLTIEDFVQRSKLKHGDKYIYDHSIYNNSKTNIRMFCNKERHGFFEQLPQAHMKGQGCPSCCNDSKRKGKDKFTEESNEVHNFKYDYSKVLYINDHTPVIIICNVGEHGEFLQLPCNHSRGRGCQKCGGNYRKNTDDFITDAKEIHNNMYDYSLVNYINSSTNVDIICNIHKVTFQQTPSNHLKGEGCPSCHRKSETRIWMFLKDELPNFEIIRNGQWYEVMDNRRPDFRIPTLKLVIEYNGQQHFKQVLSWQCPSITRKVDILKTIQALNADYTTVHIHHKFLNNKNWKNILRKYLKLHSSPCIKWCGSEHEDHLALYEQYRNDPEELIRSIYV